MHKKELSIALPFHRGLGMDVRVAEQIDTDQFGTFSGEVERTAPPREVAVRKACLALLGHPEGFHTYDIAPKSIRPGRDEFCRP